MFKFKEKKITIKINQKTFILLSAVLIITFSAGMIIWSQAAFIEPDFAPGSSDQDFAENILGANNADNEFNSGLVAGNPDGSIIERLQGMQDDYVYSFYTSLTKPQQFQVYDDWNCANNNEGGTSACGAGDPEYTGEEGEWATSTDSNISTQYIVSGTVVKDLRTGLYWSDAYDSTQGGNGAEDTIDNDFCATSTDMAPCSGSCSGSGGGGCSDADINSGNCQSSDYACHDSDGDGSAIDFCENLSLDADGDATDETDWRLPTQKELMQAYINGAANNLPNPDHDYWSSTERYSHAGYAWLVYLTNGYTYYTDKTTPFYARCVRR